MWESGSIVPGGVALETLAQGRELNPGQKGEQNKPPTCRDLAGRRRGVGCRGRRFRRRPLEGARDCDADLSPPSSVLAWVGKAGGPLGIQGAGRRGEGLSLRTWRAISVLSELEAWRTGVQKLEQESGNFFLEGHAANSLNTVCHS